MVLDVLDEGELDEENLVGGGGWIGWCWMCWMSWTRMSWLEEEDGVVASAASPAPGPVWVELPADSVFNPKTSSHGFPARVNRFNF